MGFFRLLLYGIIFYLAYHFFIGLFGKKESKTEVGGKKKSKPLDLKDVDVEDAHYREIDDDRE